jgi:hypothetical protein
MRNFTRAGSFQFDREHVESRQINCHRAGHAFVLAPFGIDARRVSTIRSP